MPQGWSPPTGGGSGWSPAVWQPPKPRRVRAKPARIRPPVKPTLQHVANPFAPIGDAQLQAQAGGLVQGQLAPIIAAIKAAIEGRSQSGQAAIQEYTQQLGNLWKGAPGVAAGAYNQAQAQQSGINTALANRLGNFGQGLSSEVGNKLAYAGPSGEQVSSNLGTAAQGTANANFAKGAAGTEMLNAQSAAAQTAAGQLPGIAGLTGLQNSKQLQAQLNKELGDQLSGVQSNAASSVSSIYQHLVDRELQKAIASQSGLINRDKLAVDKSNKAATLKYKRDKLRIDAANKAASLGISAQRVAEYARHNGISETQASKRLTQQAQRNAQQQKNQNLRQNKWQTNPNGTFKFRLNKKTGKQERIPLKPAKGGGGSGL